jgi:cell division protein FtsL
MTRINLVLLLAVVASALYLVNVQYQSRRLFTELHRAQTEERRLESEFERLQVDKRAEATSARVDKLAREKLEMRLVQPAITTYVRYADGAEEPGPVASGTVGSMAPVASASGAKP